MSKQPRMKVRADPDQPPDKEVEEDAVIRWESEGGTPHIADETDQLGQPRAYLPEANAVGAGAASRRLWKRKSQRERGSPHSSAG